MINQMVLGLFGEIGIVGTIQCTSRTTLFLTRKNKFFSLGTLILTCNFLVLIYRRYLSKRCLAKDLK